VNVASSGEDDYPEMNSSLSSDSSDF